MSQYSASSHVKICNVWDKNNVFFFFNLGRRRKLGPNCLVFNRSLQLRGVENGF